MPLRPEKRAAIKGLIVTSIRNKLRETELEGLARPFHETLFSQERIRTASFFHSCSGAIGTALFEKMARLIAEDHFPVVRPQYRVVGILSARAQAVIEDIIDDLGRRSRHPRKRHTNIAEEAREVVDVSGGEGIETEQIADLFLQKPDGEEIYLQMKTSKPNKGESEEAKRQMLKTISLRNRPVKTLVCMNYNPYEPESYRWTIPLNYLKVGDDLLIGRDFWDFIGGQGTYQELLELFDEAGRELAQLIERKFRDLGLGQASLMGFQQ